MALLKGLTAGVAGAALLCLSATAYAHGPIALTDSQLDRVTAGFGFGVSTAALAGGGNLALTQTDGGVYGTTQSLSNGGFTQTGVAGGTASAVAPGGSYATGVDTTGSVAGSTLVNSGIHGTVVGSGGSISVGFTYVSGGMLSRP
jgi:hypothetical protein